MHALASENRFGNPTWTDSVKFQLNHSKRAQERPILGKAVAAQYSPSITTLRFGHLACSKMSVHAVSLSCDCFCLWHNYACCYNRAVCNIMERLLSPQSSSLISTGLVPIIQNCFT